MRRGLAMMALAWLWASAPPAGGYPLDAAEKTGILRLEGYRMAQDYLLRSGRLAPGATLPSEGVRLRLLQHPDLELPAPDPDLGAALRRLLGADAPRYGVALLDLTDPEHPVYAEHNGSMHQNPGSVGKIVVGLAWFQALADLHPDDVEARRRLLRDTEIVADEFIYTDHHVIPFWKPGDSRVVKRTLQLGDRANLYTFLDWMLSSSNNSAAATLMEHLVLLKHFGHEYPVSEKVKEAFFAETPKTELQRIFLDAIQSPITRNGLDLDALRQGSFFTREGKRRVPGTSSHATARELVRYMLRLEQGRLVDPFSSLELKKLLYLTDRRIRYASAPALRESAVYYKSGSLYSCQPEPGFECKKYHGNVRNYMNSVAIVETHDRNPPLHYISALLSNVLRVNSAVAHQTFGARVQHLIEGQHPELVLEDEPAAGEAGSGTPETAPSEETQE